MKNDQQDQTHSQRNNLPFSGKQQVIWFLWTIGADKREQVEFLKLFKYMEQMNTRIITFSELNKLQIRPHTSALIQRMLRMGYCRKGSVDLEIRRREIGDQVGRFKEEIKMLYGRLAEDPAKHPFPTSEFTDLPDWAATEIHLDELKSTDLSSLISEGRFLLLRYPNHRLPTLILFPGQLEEFASIAQEKIILSLGEFAGESEDFFSQKVLTARTNLRGKIRDLLNQQLSTISAPTEQQHRILSTRHILRRIFSLKDARVVFMNDLISPENSFILTRYNYENPAHLDFLQSMEFLKIWLLQEKDVSPLTPQHLAKTVLNDLNLYISEDELREQTLKEFPSLSEEKYQEVYERFLNDFTISRDNKGSQSVLRVRYFNSQKQAVTVLIHGANLNSLLDSLIRKTKRNLLEHSRRQWKIWIQAHAFQLSMFRDTVLRDSLRGFIETKAPLLAALMKTNYTFEILGQRNNKTAAVNALCVYRLREPEKVLGVDRMQLYHSTYDEVVNELSGLKRLFFRIMHSLSRYFYLKKQGVSKDEAFKKAVEAPAGAAGEAVKEPQAMDTILQSAGVKSDDELRAKADGLWKKIPSTHLERYPVDRNIQSDLNAYFRDRDGIPLQSLDFIIDTNVNRMVSKAPQLGAYKERVEAYITAQVYSIIYHDSFLRGKVMN